MQNSLERLRELEKFYGTLALPFKVITFDNQAGRFKVNRGKSAEQNLLDFPIDVIVLRQYSQYKAFVEENGKVKVELYTTIEPKASLCKSLKDGTPRDVLKEKHSLTYFGWFLSLVKLDNTYQPALIILSGYPLSSFISARQKRSGMSIKYTIKDVENVITTTGTGYELVIDISDINGEEADIVLSTIEPDKPNNVIFTFETYRKAYNTIDINEAIDDLEE